MKKLILITTIIVTCAGSLFAQDTTSSTNVAGDVASATVVGTQDRAITIDSGTHVAAQLQKAIDVRKAKVGDPVVLKTTEALKSGGRRIVDKGALLHGRVTDVQRKARANGESSVSMVFDRLEKGSLMVPISATISSISQTNAGLNANDDLFGANNRSRTTSSVQSAPPPSSSGNLLGGVTNTVGNVLNTTTSTVGGVVNTTGDTVGNTTSGVGRTISGVRISQPVNASASGESTLSLTGSNLRLEKGTSFHLSLDQVMSTNSTR